MTQMDKTNAGRRVELVHTSDPYTNLKPGDQGTYEWVLRQTPPMQDQHCISWDNGSNLSLLGGVDSFKFVNDKE